MRAGRDQLVRLLLDKGQGPGGRRTGGWWGLETWGSCHPNMQVDAMSARSLAPIGCVAGCVPHTVTVLMATSSCSFSFPFHPITIPYSHAHPTPTAQAAVRVSGLELGGLVGSMIAGRVSDWLIERSNGKGGNVGKRVQVRGCDMHDACTGGQATHRAIQQQRRQRR